MNKLEIMRQALSKIASPTTIDLDNSDTDINLKLWSKMVEIAKEALSKV